MGETFANVLLNYVHEPFDYAYVFIDASGKQQRTWLAELAKAMGITIAYRLGPDALQHSARPIAYGDALALRAWNGKYVSADLNQESQLFATAGQIQAWEIFEVVDALEPVSPERGSPVRYGDLIALRAMNSGKFVGANLDHEQELTAWVPWVRGWEVFVLVRPPKSLCLQVTEHLVNEGRVAMQAANGRFVSCRLDTDQRVVAEASTVKEWELFTVLHIS